MNRPLLPDQFPSFVAVAPTTSGAWGDVHDKYTGAVASRVAMANTDDIEHAIRACAGAFDALRRWPAWRRKEVLAHLARRVHERRDEFAAVLAVEVGKTLREARAEVVRAIETFTIASEESVRRTGEFMPLDISERAERYSAIWKRVPVGPIVMFSAFNFPLNLAAHKIAPAVAVGCPFVLKPSPRAPLTTMMLGEILTETDLPHDSFSVIACDNEHALRLATDERVRLLSFTGSCSVGWHLKSMAGRKRVVLELGGNAACILDASADPDQAVDRIVAGAFGAAGQSCISVQRIIVHESLYDSVRVGLAARTSALRSGDPFDDGVDVGPMISEEAARRVETWVSESVGRGATVLAGGSRHGARFEPTLLENVSHDARVWREEVFGPVATLESAPTFAEAVRRANDSAYGLHAGVFSNDLEHAHRAWDDLEVGGVVINDVPTSRVDSMPYGGVKASGIGREGVRFAMDDFTEIRTLVTHRPQA